MLSAVALAIVLFASRNIDDIFVLLGFFANPKFQTRQISIGQYLGFAALVPVSRLASLVLLVFSPAHVGFLGLPPILIGGKKLSELWAVRDKTQAEATKPGLGNVLTIASVTMANGGDNIGVYTPVFATNPAPSILVFILVFAIMVAVWIAISHWLVNHRTLGAPIRRIGRVAMPVVLILIGAFIRYEAGTLSLLSHFIGLFDSSAVR